ncbi:MAG TPA: DNA-3-methyladenine glycosylase I [Anaerolineales bacterium]|nr:DNA-3-methyladenine glycosylase I [Anaerolineales bacterium]
MLTYCQYVLAHPEDELNRNYHDTEYGYPLENDNLLFERLVLEINQAGLSWSLILKKKENFRKAYLNFEMNEVAQFDEYDFLRMMNDQGIIRNRLKINAAIVNAKTIIKLQKTSGSFKQWLDMHTQYSLEEWVKLFKKNFRFTGREIVREFLLSTGYLPGSHDEDCPVYDKILQLEPPWMKNSLS